jgi:hypothetical protein
MQRQNNMDNNRPQAATHAHSSPGAGLKFLFSAFEDGCEASLFFPSFPCVIIVTNLGTSRERRGTQNRMFKARWNNKEYIMV